MNGGPVRRIALLTATLAVGIILYYLSRFWDFRLWDRPGLFGWEQLPPQGGLVGRWLRGTDFAVFELLIWGIGAILVLSLLEKLYGFLTRSKG